VGNSRRVTVPTSIGGAHSQEMERILSRIVGLLFSVCMAALVALTVGYVAHYDFGVSRLDIRMAALTGAATFALIAGLLLATEWFEKKVRKSK
jgi:hypothetical protein